MISRIAIAALALALGSAGAFAKPKLVVVICVDQMRADSLDRFSAAFEGGIRFLRQKSVRYGKALHNHSMTQTAPGHLTLFSGKYPGPAAVPANEFYDPTQKRFVYCVEDTTSPLLGRPNSRADRGRSFRRVRATNLGDWMKAASPKSKVFSISGKDRSAILMGGATPDGAYWYDDKTGEFTTSAYYADTHPAFVRRFNALRIPDKSVGRSWTRVAPETLYLQLAGRDDQIGEADLEGMPAVFPYHFDTRVAPPDERYYERFYDLPWLDEYTIEFAKELVRSEKLGADAAPDLLALGLSACDPIGHRCGPNSHESLDALLRVDRLIGEFLEFIDKTVSLEKTVVVLTSDHGATPLVEFLKSRNIPSERAGKTAKAFQRRVADFVGDRYGDPSRIFAFQGREVIYLDHAYVKEKKLSAEEILKDVRFLASSETWIDRIYDRAQLVSAAALNPVGELVRHSFHPHLGADLYIIPRRYYFTPGYDKGASHGWPYDDDRHVPMLIYDPERPAKSFDTPVATVDLAPTLAKLLGVELPGDLDGEILPGWSE